MARSSDRSKRKVSGGLYRRIRKPKLSFLSRNPSLTKIGEKKVKGLKVLGGKKKLITLSSDLVNVYDSKEKRYKKAKIKTVLDNPANRHYVRRNIITKGTVVDTELGRAKITNRPGQEGLINAVLL